MFSIYKKTGWAAGFAIALFAAALVGCHGGGGGTDTTDPVNPESPGVESDPLSVGRSLSITFSSPMDTASVEAATGISIEGQVVASISKAAWTPANLHFYWSLNDTVLKIAGPFPYCAEIALLITTDAMDKEGVHLGQPIEAEVEMGLAPYDFDEDGYCTDDLAFFTEGEADGYHLIVGGSQVIAELGGENYLGPLVADAHYISRLKGDEDSKNITIIGRVSEDGGAAALRKTKGEKDGGAHLWHLNAYGAEEDSVLGSDDTLEFVNAAALGDVDGDGRTDIAVITDEAGEDSILGNEDDIVRTYYLAGADLFEDWSDAALFGAEIFTTSPINLQIYETPIATYEAVTNSGCGSAMGDYNGDALSDSASCIDYGGSQAVIMRMPEVSSGGVVSLPDDPFEGRRIMNLTTTSGISIGQIGALPDLHSRIVRMDAGDLDMDGVDEIVAGYWNNEFLAGEIADAQQGILIMENSASDPTIRYLHSMSTVKISGGIDDEGIAHILEPYVVGDINADGIKDLLAIDSLYEVGVGFRAQRLLGFLGRLAWTEMTYADYDFVFSDPEIAMINGIDGNVDLNNDGYGDVIVDINKGANAVLLGGEGYVNKAALTLDDAYSILIEGMPL